MRSATCSSSDARRPRVGPEWRQPDTPLSGRWPSAHWARGLRVLLLLVLFAQLLFSALLKSPTIDEPNHLTRGYAYLKTGDLRLSRDEGHPPLFNLICALPLALIENLDLPVYLPSWQSGFRNAFAVEFVFGAPVRNDVPLAQIVFLGRLPVMLATMCLAALIARWASDLYGPWGSLLALVLCTFDPNTIAHGRLATTDMGITLFTLGTCYLFGRFLRAPAWPLLASTGIVLGLAQACKFSALLLVPLLGLLGLVEVLHPRGSLVLVGRLAAKGIPRWLAGLAVLTGVMVVLLALAVVSLWAVYGFQVGRPAGWTIDIPAPVYAEGLQKTLAHAADFGHPAFLMGRRSTHGWWYYFPVAFALKTPLPSLIALLCALTANLWRQPHVPTLTCGRLADVCRQRAIGMALAARRRAWGVDWLAELPLVLVPTIYFASSMRSVLNIGYRHLLPILPFLWVYAGRLALPIEHILSARHPVWKRGLVAGSMATLGLWLVAGTLSVAPHYLAYFNAVAGGPDGGWRYLVDSNLDWGQDLPSLKKYVDEQGTAEPVHLSWFGSTYPHLYGLDLSYRLLPSHLSYPYAADAARSPYNPLHPAPGLYAIGTTNLSGVGLAAGDVFESFRVQEPIARVGHSIHIYEVAVEPESLAPTCISRLRFKDLSNETEEVSLGRGQGAVKWFDHERSFILPALGDPAYVLPEPPLAFAPAWQDAFMARAKVVHAQTQRDRAPSGRMLPDAVVYRFDRASADDMRQEMLTAMTTAPKSWSPTLVFDGSAEIHPLLEPATFDHGLELLGYVLVSGETLLPGEALELITVWRSAAEMPGSASDLTVFVHLLDERSRVWGGEDRLDLHPPTWERGDLLVQHHLVPLAADAASGTYQVEIGLYAAITLERLRLYVDGSPVGDRLLLQPIQVSAQ